MYSRLGTFFDTQLAALMRDDYAAFVSDYDFPLALQIEGEWVVYTSPLQLIEDLRTYRQWLLSIGVTILRCRINAVDVPRGDRFRVWTTVFHTDPQSATTTRSENLFFVREKRGRFLIEMVQCTETETAEFTRSRWPAPQLT
jgi:hypothetical protein